MYIKKDDGFPPSNMFDIGNPTLISPSVIIKDDYLSLLSQIKEYKKQLYQINRSISVYTEDYNKSGDPLLKKQISHYEQLKEELNIQYSDILSKYDSTKKVFKHLSYHEINFNPFVTPVIIDRAKLRFYLVELDSDIFLIYKTDINKLIKRIHDNDNLSPEEKHKEIIKLRELKEVYNNYFGNSLHFYDDGQKYSSFAGLISHFLKDIVSNDYDKYGLSKPIDFYRDPYTKSPMLLLKFKSGLEVRIKNSMPFYIQLGFNVIEYSGNPVNYVETQNNFEALTFCINKAKKELLNILNILFPLRVSDNPEDNILPLKSAYDHNSLDIPLSYRFPEDHINYVDDYYKTGISFENLLNFNLSKFYFDYIEIHRNLMFKDKRFQRLMHNTLYRIGLSCNWCSYNYINGTSYFFSSNLPKNVIYDKTKELIEVSKYDLKKPVSRFEIKFDTNDIEMACKTINSVYDDNKLILDGSPSRSNISCHYYYSNDKLTPDISPKYLETEFNEFLNNIYSKYYIFDRYLKLVDDIGKHNIPSMLNQISKDGTLNRILYYLSTPKDMMELCFISGFSKSAINRRLSLLKGLYRYNHYSSKYELTILGSFFLNDPSLILKLSMLLNSLDISSLSNTFFLSIPHDIEDFLFSFLSFIVNDKKDSIIGGDPNGT